MKTYLITLFFISTLTINAQDQIPNIMVTNIHDDFFNMKDSVESGKNYILNIYANWCGPCKVEAIQWQECYSEWQEKYNLEIVILSTDGYNNQNVIDWFEEKEFDYKLWRTEADSVYSKLGVNAFPTSFFINTELLMIDTIIGSHNCESMEKLLDIHFGTTAISEKSATPITIKFEHSQILIELTPAQLPAQAQIFDLSGRKLISQKLELEDAFINLEALNKGQIFVIQILPKDRQIYSQKFFR